jgi:predicted nucleic acid-binding protein
VNGALVLDSWILLAWLKGQRPGAAAMDLLWRAAAAGRVRLFLNLINLGEVYYLTAKAASLAQAGRILQQLRAMPVEIWPVSEELVLEAARLKARFPISYADAFAAATARSVPAPLATGDPEFRKLERQGLLELRWAGNG